MKDINFIEVFKQFGKPYQALWAIIATAFVLLMLTMDSFVDVTAAKLVTDFAGVLGLIIATGLLGRGARLMSKGRKKMALLFGTLGLSIFAVGVIEILIAGAADFSKELAGMVGGAMLGFFSDDD